MRFVLALLLLATPAAAAEPPYAYLGKVVRVADGDTLTVSIDGWPAPVNPVEVRVDGIDTPESRRGDARCARELKLGLIAKRRARELLPKGASVLVVWSGRHEKYGRLLATVTLPDGRDFAALQIREGMAKRYSGGRKPDWCR